MKAPMDTTKLDREMGKTKIHLMTNPKAVFFSTLVLGLKTVWDDSQPTAYVNGKAIGWNSTFFLGLDRDERVFVSCHEALHVIWKHLLPGRREGKKPKLWNAACDFAINGTLVDFGFKMPKIGLYDARFKAMDADEIYSILEQESYAPPGGMMEDLREPEGDIKQHETEVTEMLIRAVTVAKMGKGAGLIPGNIEVMLQDLLDPKLPWHTILYRWLNARVKTGYTYWKPNKRYMPDTYMPSRTSKGLKKLVVFMDLSSSVSDEQARMMASEMTGVIKRFKTELTIITFNTEITGIHKAKLVSDIKKIQFQGRGGTDLTCVFDWIEQNKPDASVIFTDGDFYFDRDTLSRDVVWVINDNPHFQAKFGKVVHYETR